MIEAAAININQPFPTSPSSVVASACPKVHLPWPLIPSLCLMMSLPGSHANGPGSQQGAKAIAPWETVFNPVQCGVCHNRWRTHPAPLIFITSFLFKQEHFSSAHHVSYGPVMHSLSSRGGSLNGFRRMPSNYHLCIPAHPPSL